MKGKKSFGKFFFLHFEWMALLVILLASATIDPSSGSLFCPLEWMGIKNCPGEGIGRSMASVFRGDIISSFYLHPAGVPAIAIILARIGSIFYRNRNFTNPNQYHEST